MCRRHFFMYKNRVDGDSGLFIIIMPFALGYSDVVITDSVNKPVLIIDPPTPFPFWTVFQRLRFSFTCKRLSLDRLDLRRLFIFFKVILSCDCQQRYSSHASSANVILLTFHSLQFFHCLYNHLSVFDLLIRFP